MKAAVWLRVVSALAFVQFCAHTVRFITYAPAHGPDEVAVVQAMKSHYFLFAGAPRSYWDFYFGYGLLAAFSCLVEAVLFWLLAGIARSSVALARPIVVLFLLANIAHATLTWTYFFPLPMYFDLAIAILLGVALITAFRAAPGEPAVARS